MKTTNTNLTNYETNLNNRVNNNNEIKALKSSNKALMVEALKIVNTLIKDEEVLNVNFKDMKNKDKANFILNYKVDSKDEVVKTVLKYKALGLTIHFNLTISALNDCVSFYNSKDISKSNFKDEVKLIEALKSARKIKELARCQKVVNDNK